MSRLRVKPCLESGSPSCPVSVWRSEGLSMRRFRTDRSLMGTRRTWFGLVTIVITVVLCGLSSPVVASERVWQELRDGKGMVILYRHALAPGSGDPTNFDISACSTQRNLSDAGRDQARDMGAELLRRGVRVRRVLSSPWCRSRETAELMRLGPVHTMKRFGSTYTTPAQITKRRADLALRTIARQSGRTGVLVVTSHQVNIIDLTGIAPISGEGIVVRYEGNELEVVGRVPAPAIR